MADLFALVGRPFAPAKHQPPSLGLVHLGLFNDFSGWRRGWIRLQPREGKLDELTNVIEELLQEADTSVAAVESLIGSLLFLIVNCFGKVGRGGFQALHVWCSENDRNCLLYTSPSPRDS